MPTAADHRREAGSLTDLLDSARNVRARIVHDRDDVGIRGGPSMVVGWAFDAAVADLDQLGRVGASLFDELHRRAGLCDQYTAALQRHTDAHRRWVAALDRYRATVATDHPAPWPGPEPLPPVAPFRGAEAG